MDTAGGRSVPLPDDGLPVIERSAVRLVVLDAEGRLLLIYSRDLCNPGLRTCFFGRPVRGEHRRVQRTPGWLR